MTLRALARCWLPGAVRKRLRVWLEEARLRGLWQALGQQGLLDLYQRLAQIAPDVRDQYSAFPIDSQEFYEERPDYLEITVRAQHAFQISLVQGALQLLGLDSGAQKLTVVDIGDSAGTHIRYLQGLHANVRALSVNIDPLAVQRIRSKGLEAILARAEEVDRYDVEADIFLCFETIEHLTDPSQFLANLATVAANKALVVSVPYVARSRVGLGYIRHGIPKPIWPESVHIFELSPEDWRLIFSFSGWRVVNDRVYRQYPVGRPLQLLKPVWEKLDFEGFYGAVLVRDLTWRSYYQTN